MATWSSDYAVIAYDAATGSQVWSATYNGAENGFDSVGAIKVSPDGSRVYVTGGVTKYEGSTELRDAGTIAYDAATGAQLWIALYDSLPGSSSGTGSLTLSPDGAKLYVTGQSSGNGMGDDFDYVTIAYDATNGTQLWASRYQNPQAPYDAAYSVSASPDGEKVFVTGSTDVGATTVAYDAQDGKELWVAKESGPAQVWTRSFTTIASVDSSRVYITGWTASSESDLNYFTSAYDAATGSKLWSSEYGEPDIEDGAYTMTQNGDGSLVFVTGQSARDYATIAYNSITGDEVWVARYSGSTEPDGWDTPTDIAITTTGQVLVTGTIADFSRGLSQDYYGTVAYDASTGQQLWATHSGTGNERATAIAVNPAGTRAFVTGMSTEFQTREDWATFALELGDGFDGTAPTSSFDTNDEAIFVATPLTPSPYVSGSATDDHSGVAEVMVLFEPLVPLGTTLTQSASLSCMGHDRRSCTWSTPLPSTPGRYRVSATARDRDHNLESPGPTPIEILVI
jgi:outer membrane protein assembly factor BamB